MEATNAPARATPAVWGQVPQRNRNFTGRAALLDQLRNQLNRDEVTAVLPHALQGLGGVGKTQLAVEFAYRESANYDVVWWIPADQPQLIRSSLAALAPRLGLTGIAPARQEEAVSAVLDALRRGEPHSRWLLIFDNADQPESIREFFPPGKPGGHVLVTSRNRRWQIQAETVEVDVFARAESLEFLQRRVVGIKDADAGRLAVELGDLPLALEQAGAFQFETGMSVDEYLAELEKAATKILAENPPSDYPLSVAAAWDLSMSQLREQMPFGLEFLRRCAFFGPEPIPRDLFVNGARALELPLRDQLSDPILVGRAMRGLGRYALARIDNNRRTVQVHRLVQRLIRDDLTPEEVDLIRQDVHSLLVAADPRDPDDNENWDRYRELLAHLDPSGIVASTSPGARRLVWNVGAYLYNIGAYSDCSILQDQALARWTADSGPDNTDVLLLAGQKADVLFGLGEYKQAYELRRPTFERMRDAAEDDEFTLLVMNGYGADLRSRGEFAAALRLDEDSLERHRRVFGDDQRDTFRVVNNLGVDHELNSHYATALELHEQNYDDQVNFFGRNDHHWVVFSLTAISRVLRHQGRYTDSLNRAERATVLYREIVERRVLPADHPWILVQARDLSVVQRLAGDVTSALAAARLAYVRYRDAQGREHPETLAAGINYGNALRLAGSLGIPGGDIDKGVDRLERTVDRYAAVWTPDHPFVHVSSVNLAVARLAQGQKEKALELLQDSGAGLLRTVGADHHYSLVCATNLATASAELGDVESAQVIGIETLDRLTELLGPTHPHTLACAVNLRLDQVMLGDAKAAEQRKVDIGELVAVIGKHHHDVVTAREGGRVSSVIEPPPL
jgi:tetratricopeptide (TPR) repeat protein